jgi:hypothetical protein
MPTPSSGNVSAPLRAAAADQPIYVKRAPPPCRLWRGTRLSGHRERISPEFDLEEDFEEFVEVPPFFTGNPNYRRNLFYITLIRDCHRFIAHEIAFGRPNCKRLSDE